MPCKRLANRVKFSASSISHASSSLSCGEAYLANERAEPPSFGGFLDHSGVAWNCWPKALAHPGVTRPNALVKNLGAPMPMLSASGHRGRGKTRVGIQFKKLTTQFKKLDVMRL